MSCYRVHGVNVDAIRVQQGTEKDAAVQLGYIPNDPDDVNSAVLVLNDFDGMEAWVISGSPDQWKALGQQIIDVAETQLSTSKGNHHA